MESARTLKASGARSGSRQRMEMLVPPVIGGLLLLIALLGLIGTAIRDPRPHDITVGLVGPASAVQQISAAFGTNAPGAFQFTTYDSELEARAAIDSRAVDGVLVLGSPPRLIVAGAAGDAATGVITAALTNVFKPQCAPPEVEVVHPFAAGDAHGLILFFVGVAVIVSALLSRALMLGALAVGPVVAGCARRLVPPGIGLAALVVVLLRLVSSGAPVGSQLLPDFYRVLAPWMPAGPLYSALRGALYFDGAGLGTPLLVLFGWIAGGLVLMLLAELVASRRRSPAASLA